MADGQGLAIPRGRPNREQRLAIDQLRRDIGALYAQRLKPGEIAERLGVPRRSINRHLRWLRVLWQEELAGKIAEIRLRELAELDAIEAEMAARYAQHGGRRWLESRLRVKALRASLLGLFAPSKHIGLSLSASEAARLAGEYGVTPERVMLEAKALVRD